MINFLDRHRGTDGHAEFVARHLRDRNKILLRVVADVLEYMRSHHVDSRVADHQCGLVGRCRAEALRSNPAPGSCLVLHHDSRAEFFTQSIAHQPCRAVRCTAGRIADDYLDRVDLLLCINRREKDKRAACDGNSCQIQRDFQHGFPHYGLSATDCAVTVTRAVTAVRRHRCEHAGPLRSHHI